MRRWLLTLTLLLLAHELGLRADVADARRTTTCDGLPATIVGTDGPDRLVGTLGVDVIAALGGDDVVLGRDGDDVICGGDGRDVVKAGNGDDRIFGQRANDRLIGQGGRDSIYGGSGRDVLSGGSDDDRLLGMGGNDRLLLGGPGHDLQDGGAGFDRCGIDLDHGDTVVRNCETSYSLTPILRYVVYADDGLHVWLTDCSNRSGELEAILWNSTESTTLNIWFSTAFFAGAMTVGEERLAITLEPRLGIEVRNVTVQDFDDCAFRWSHR